MAVINTGSQLPSQGSNSELSIQQDGNAQFLFKTGTGATSTTALTLTDTQATIAKNVTFVAGTTSAAPLTLTTGTLKTSPSAGDIEFVTGQFYMTPASSSVRHIMPAAQFYTGTNTLSNVTTSTGQSVFGKAVTLAVGSYLFEATFYSTVTLTIQSNLSVALAGTAGGNFLATLNYTTDTGTSFNTSASLLDNWGNIGGFGTYCTCMVVSVNGTKYNVMSMIGSMSITSAGTVEPRFKATSSTITTIAVNAGSYFYIYPIQDNVGSWA